MQKKPKAFRMLHTFLLFMRYSGKCLFDCHAFFSDLFLLCLMSDKNKTHINWECSFLLEIVE